jgi:hypothetical protein
MHIAVTSREVVAYRLSGIGKSVACRSSGCMQRTFCFQLRCASKSGIPGLRYATETIKRGRGKTKANVQREESLLLVASHSIIFLTHIAIAATSNAPSLSGCDVRQSLAS